MKKFIVMLLVLAVCVGGVFASDENHATEGTGKSFASNNTNGNVTAADNPATMIMVYDPKVFYCHLGFDSATSPTVSLTDSNEHKHLTGLSGFDGLKTLTLTTATSEQKVVASGSFNIFYEVMTKNKAKITLSFEENFVAVDSTDTTNKFDYSATLDSSKKTGSEKTFDVATLDPASGYTLFSGVKTVTIATEDLAELPMKTYAATVTMTIESTT